MNYLLAAALFTALLSSCANPLGRYPSPDIMNLANHGMTKQEVLQALGPPTGGTAAAGDKEYLAYWADFPRVSKKPIEYMVVLHRGVVTETGMGAVFRASSSTADAIPRKQSEIQ